MITPTEGATSAMTATSAGPAPMYLRERPDGVRLSVTRREVEHAEARELAEASQRRAA